MNLSTVYSYLQRFIQWWIMISSVQIGIRLLESILIYPNGNWGDILPESVFDLTFSSFIALTFAPLHFSFFKIARRYLVVFEIVIVASLVFLGYSTARYFSISNVPLGSVVLSYTLSELTTISNTEEGFRMIDLAYLLALFALLFWCFRKVQKLTFSPRYIWVFFLLIILGSGSYIPFNYSQKFNDKTGRYFVRVNKSGYFMGDILLHNPSLATESTSLTSEKVDAFHAFFPHRTGLDKEYPLLHDQALTTPLSSFFNDTDSFPNVVIIIIESLGRYYSGAQAEYGSYTPFLDSLAQHSLYWENCISGSDRTFGVLPSLLGSLPTGERGFSDLLGKMPRHLSLIPILKKNGYQTHFFMVVPPFLIT